MCSSVVQVISYLFTSLSNTMASWLVSSPLDQAAQVQALPGDIVLCS